MELNFSMRSLFLWLPLIIIASFAVESWSLKTSDGEEASLHRFREYLRIRSVHPSPDYAAAARFITQQAKEIGLHAETLELVQNKPLVLLTWHGSESEKLESILLNSHTDVVPVEEEKWSYDPFSAEMDSEGNIYGRGSQDMKSVGMQHLEAIRILKDSGFKPFRSLHLSFVPDEEVGGHDGMEKFVNSQRFKELNVGLMLDEGLACPDEFYRVFYGEKAPWWLVIKAHGSPGHGSKLYDHGALENLFTSIESISSFRKSQFDLIKAGLASEGDVVSINPVYLKAGTPTPTGFVMNLQPSEAEAGFDIRVPPLADPVSLEKRIEVEWAPKSRNMTYEFKQKEPLTSKAGLPLVTILDNSNPWWRLLNAAVKEAGGVLEKPDILPGATDSRYVREKGIPAIGFSPMANTPLLLHDHNEFLNKDQYIKGIKVYVQIIKSFLSFTGEKGNTDTESRNEL